MRVHANGVRADRLSVMSGSLATHVGKAGSATLHSWMSHSVLMCNAVVITREIDSVHMSISHTHGCVGSGPSYIAQVYVIHPATHLSMRMSS
jgi:hypothetical protein